MAELKGQPSELQFTVEVKRAATGKVETYRMIGKTDGGHSHDSRTKRSD